MGAIRRIGVAKEPGTAIVSLPSLLEFHSPSAALSLAPVRGPARATTWVICTLVAACGAAATLIPVDKVVVAQGRVVALHPTSVVQPLETAIVREVRVREGQTVQRGEILARLDSTFAGADLGTLTTQVGSLEAEVARLEAEATRQAYQAPNSTPASVLQGALYTQREAERTFKREGYRWRISALQEQIRRSTTDVTAFTGRHQVATELESRRAELERLQVGSRMNRLAATDTRLEITRGLEGARAQLAQVSRELQVIEAERDGYEQQWQSQVGLELAEAMRKLPDAREQLSKAQLRRQLVDLRAEQDSIVLTVARVSPGSVLQSGDQFLTLVPLDAPLEAEVNVAGSDAGFVHVGNPVTVKFDTFPFTQYGFAEGTVRVLSADSFTADTLRPQRGAAEAPQPGAQSFYRTRITLDRIGLHDTPPGFRLTPGTPITADVKVGQHTVMSYLLGRMLPLAMEGMREP